MNIGKLKLAIMVSALFVAAQARASLFDLTFTERDAGPTIANGQIDVISGVAVSGFLDVTGGAGLGSYTLQAGSGSDGSFNWDSAVAVGSNPFLGNAGLLFVGSGVEVNMYTDSNGYNLWGNIGGNWNPMAIGDATLTSVPDGGLTVALLGGAFACLALLRRRFVS
jgi:hypothetical protein